MYPTASIPTALPNPLISGEVPPLPQVPVDTNIVGLGNRYPLLLLQVRTPCLTIVPDRITPLTLRRNPPRRPLNPIPLDSSPPPLLVSTAVRLPSKLSALESLDILRWTVLFPRCTRLALRIVPSRRTRTLDNCLPLLETDRLNLVILPVCLPPLKLKIDKRPLRAFPPLYLTLRLSTMVVSRLPLQVIYRPNLALCSALFPNLRVDNVRPKEISALSFCPSFAAHGIKLTRKRGAVLLTRRQVSNISNAGPCCRKLCTHPLSIPVVSRLPLAPVFTPLPLLTRKTTLRNGPLRPLEWTPLQQLLTWWLSSARPLPH